MHACSQQRVLTVFLCGRCINSRTNNEANPRSRRIDSSFYTTDGRGGKESNCLILGVVQGKLDCKFWLDGGLGADIAAVKPLHNRALQSAVRRRAASWSVNVYDMPDDSKPHTRSYAEVGTHTRVEQCLHMLYSMKISFFVTASNE